jgi:hypothetical protein
MKELIYYGSRLGRLKRKLKETVVKTNFKSDNP